MPEFLGSSVIELGHSTLKNFKNRTFTPKIIENLQDSWLQLSLFIKIVKKK
jgi:hypothetical protein